MLRFILASSGPSRDSSDLLPVGPTILPSDSSLAAKRFSEFIGRRKRYSEFLGGKKRYSEFLGGKKRYSEFLGGKKRYSEFLGGKKRYSEFLGGKRSSGTAPGAEDPSMVRSRSLRPSDESIEDYEQQAAYL